MKIERTAVDHYQVAVTDERHHGVVLGMYGSRRRYVVLQFDYNLQTKIGSSLSGNSLKAGVRFVSYDHFKHMLADSEVRLLTDVKIVRNGLHLRSLRVKSVRGGVFSVSYKIL